MPAALQIRAGNLHLHSVGQPRFNTGDNPRCKTVDIDGTKQQSCVKQRDNDRPDGKYAEAGITRYASRFGKRAKPCMGTPRPKGRMLSTRQQKLARPSPERSGKFNGPFKALLQRMILQSGFCSRTDSSALRHVNSHFSR
ncbi:MAG: hypothetical protein H6881_09065 [Rhodobiaceae bacterium]|nr:hypothetical protein [Rhodobiaceae bacterium]MCC0061644.1 hypothetical protein [Rhodobiaceae bacterium]